MADELENPSQQKKAESVWPKPVNKDCAEKECDRKQDGWDAERVAGPVHAVLMAGGVLGDPLLAGAVAQHAGRIIHEVATSVHPVSRVCAGL